MLQNIVSMKNSIILVLILPRYKVLPKNDAENVVTGCFFFSRKNGQNDVTQVKLFIMTVKSLLEVQTPITVNLDFTKYNPV